MWLGQGLVPEVPGLREEMDGVRQVLRGAQVKCWEGKVRRPARVGSPGVDGRLQRWFVGTPSASALCVVPAAHLLLTD